MRRHVVMLLLVACGGAHDAEQWTGVIDTLPNGTIHVANPSRGVWPDGAGWRLGPAAVIGAAEGAEAVVFGAVSGLEVDDAGRIYVLDRHANELRIFAPDGAHIRTVGRSGGGPGEYRNANGLRWLTADTLVAVDQRGGRYTVLSREGEYVRSVPRQLGFYGWVFAGGCVDGRIYEQSYVGSDPDGQPVLLGTALQGGDSATTVRDTVPLPAAGAPILEGFSVRTARGGMGLSVPFAPGVVYHLDRAGGIWHGHGSAFRLFRSSFAGDTLREVVLEVPPTPVTAAELADWEAGDDVKQFRDMGGRIDMDRIPKVKPFFVGLMVDPDGYLWVTVPAGPMEALFRVFDPEGRYLGPIRVNGLMPDPYVPPVVRTGKLHIVGRDELDVQRVYAFTIAK